MVLYAYLSCSDSGTGRRIFGGVLGLAYTELMGAAGFTKPSAFEVALADGGADSLLSS